MACRGRGSFTRRQPRKCLCDQTSRGGSREERGHAHRERIRSANPAPNRLTQRSSDPLLNHIPHQIGNAAAIAPFVVVPANKFEESLVQLNSGTLVKNRRG